MKNNKEYEAKIAQYAEYVNSHTEEIAKKVTDAFEEQQEFLKASVLSYVKEHYLTPLPAHKEWIDTEGCGELLADFGLISINQTLGEFLNEYTGKSTPVTKSKNDLYWEDYGDALSEDYVIDLGKNLMMSVIRKELEEKFGTVSDKEFEELKNASDMFDDIFDFTPPYEFNCAENALEYLGIADIPLRQLVDKKTIKSFAKIDKYIATLENNQEEVVKFINEVFEKNKPGLAKLMKELVVYNYLTPNYPPHFELRVDKNTRNKSEQLQKTGTVSPDCTVKDFLLNEYTGDSFRFPRKKNSRIRHWVKYIEDICFSMLEYTGFLLDFSIKCYFSEKQNTDISEDDLIQIKNNFHNFAVFIENSIVVSIITEPDEFTGIGDLKLGDIVNEIRFSSPLCDTEVQKDLIKEIERIRASRPISFAGKDRNSLGNLDMDVVCELYARLENDVPGLEYLIKILAEGNEFFSYPVLRPIYEEEYDELPPEGKITRIELAEASLPVLKKYLE